MRSASTEAMYLVVIALIAVLVILAMKRMGMAAYRKVSAMPIFSPSQVK